MTTLLWLALVPTANPVDDAAFETQVRPVLAAKCVKCHGPDKSSAGLRVDSREALLRGGENGPALVPGKPDESLLIKAARRHDKDVSAMPPDKPLVADEVLSLEKWVRDGAVWPATATAVRSERHWSFLPVKAVTPPNASAPVDAFLARKHKELGVRPTPPADKLTLIRRATFDLTGLPPTPEDVEAFVKDTSPDAFRKVVDRLLASRHYGEKWGRHWLDVARYADTAGETADFPAPLAWKYRDYVIAAFNADKPYNELLREQIAGDILAAALPADAPPSHYAELVTATGYLAVARRFGFDPLKDHFLTLEDTIDTVSKSVLGLSIACARCHDHKYDPVTAKDYYALYGIFAGTEFPYAGGEKDKVPRGNVPLVPPKRIKDTAAGLRLIVGATAGLNADSVVAKSMPLAYAVREGTPQDAKLHKRGDPETPGEVVPRRFISILGGQPVPPNSGSGRLALADRLADPTNPLTARVMVNRIWQNHFGAGLVATPNDFGTRGSPPSHPELLDWLASEFVRSGWSIKAMHRTLMLTEAYQRSAATSAENLKADANNVSLWRYPRRRLSAEEVRDTLLAASGDLDQTPGGPHPFPDPKTWGFTQHAPFVATYDHTRRSVYLMTQRIRRHPFLALFDGTDPNASTASRQTTTVPTQALFFLNDPFVHARASGFASKLQTLPDDRARVDRAYRLMFGRPPRDVEQAFAEKFLLSAGGDKKAAWASLLRVLFGTNEFVYVD